MASIVETAGALPRVVNRGIRFSKITQAPFKRSNFIWLEKGHVEIQKCYLSDKIHQKKLWQKYIFLNNLLRLHFVKILPFLRQTCFFSLQYKVRNVLFRGFKFLDKWFERSVSHRISK